MATNIFQRVFTDPKSLNISLIFLVRLLMTLDGEDRWICGRKVCAVNLHCVSSIVRDIREPFLYHSPTKGTKMLKPDKWQAIFDADGRVLGFKKALKMIILGGVDPSIRAEVWEFLLGCYPLGTTTEYRRQLRMARRERYTHLIRQCQNMHSSIGTGTLAYAVGSKVMDMRSMSKDNESWEKDTKSGKNLQDAINEIDSYGELRNDSTNTSNACQRTSFSDSGDLVSVRESTDGAAYECFSSKPNNYFDFPPLPVTNLFHNSDNLGDEVSHRQSAERSLKSGAETMHSFQINNNADLIMESVGSSSSDVLRASNGDSEMPSSNAVIPVSESTNLGYKTEVMDILRKTNVVNVPEVAMDNDSTSNGVAFGEDRVSGWLWTLHNIVVDVVRTDSHLEFYNNSKNMARMSDILAVYAWVDPATGYCQGMSDLLSPFVILYEDDADAFWCFEMLLRRMRENFQMEGPTGVMKQLQALWKILELTDNEMFTHLSLIGAESLHFAFRMLLVLFRRELSFNEALCMWEMIWAADFNESAVQEIEVNCLEPLIVQLPRDSTVAETIVELVESRKRNSKAAQSGNSSLERSGSYNNGVRSVSSYPFCGLASASFWARTDRMPIDTVTTATKNGDDELPAFCVAAVLILNRQKVIRATHSLDDLIKMFNDKMPKINVRRCIRMAIKLRKKYFYKLMKVATMGNSEPLTDGGV